MVEIKKRRESVIERLKEKLVEEKEECEKDWRTPIKEALLGDGTVEDLKNMKDYVLMKGELYHKMFGGILARRVEKKEAQKKLDEVHNKTCKFCREVSLYHRLQRVGFYWPNMSKELNQVQSQCEAYHLAMDREESYVVFIEEDWKSPFIEYLSNGTLLENHEGRYKLKRLATRYFLHEGILFRKGYGGNLLRCLEPKIAKEMLKEVHFVECREHQGKKKLYRSILQMGYYWPSMKKDVAEFVRKCHGCQVQANLIHTHP